MSSKDNSPTHEQFAAWACDDASVPREHMAAFADHMLTCPLCGPQYRQEDWQTNTDAEAYFALLDPDAQESLRKSSARLLQALQDLLEN